MGQSISQKPMVSFVQGLITEASELTFPENASTDELNCDLFKAGNRRRRLGMAYEDSNVLSSFTYTPSISEKFSVGHWNGAGGDPDINFLVIQIGKILYFYDKSVTPVSNGALIGTITLQNAGLNQANFFECQYTNIDGRLIVVSQGSEAIYLDYDGVTVTKTIIDFEVRDFEWQGDSTSYDAEVASSSVTDGRKYDTANTGWDGTKGSAALTTYITANTAYPALTHPWYSGKDSSGNFQEAEWQKVYGGSSLTGNGHYKLDPFYRDRATASGLTIPNVPNENIQNRFTAVVASSGRVFYSGVEGFSQMSTRVYFSKVSEGPDDYGKLHQQNDPVSEDISDLLDSDGGVLKIPEASGIKRLFAYGSSILVFADNGVWQIKGVDGVFKATAYSVTKVTGAGIAGRNSLIDAEGTPFWWSDNGIHTISNDQYTGAAVESNLTTTSIQSFYDKIDANAKSEVTGTFNRVTRKVSWLYPSNGETVAKKVNEILTLDIPLQAFVPWTVSDEASNTSYILEAYSYKSDENTYLVRDGATGKLTIAGFTDTSFQDWGSIDYSSYAESAYNFMGDMLTKKTLPYLTVYCRTTETGWTGDETVGYSLVRESSLKVSAYWDFSTSPSSIAQEAYRLKTIPVVDPTDLTNFNYPETVVTTRLKLRGRGRSVRLRFESVSGKDFNLLGYDELESRNTRF